MQAEECVALPRTSAWSHDRAHFDGQPFRFRFQVAFAWLLDASSWTRQAGFQAKFQASSPLDLAVFDNQFSDANRGSSSKVSLAAATLANVVVPSARVQESLHCVQELVNGMICDDRRGQSLSSLQWPIDTPADTIIRSQASNTMTRI